MVNTGSPQGFSEANAPDASVSDAVQGVGEFGSEERRRDRRSKLLGVVLLFGVVAIGFAALRPKSQSGEKVRVTKAGQRDVISRVLSQGRIRAKRQVNVTSEIAGRVAAVYVHEGDYVHPGEPLFSLEDDKLRNAVSQLRVALEATQAGVSRMELMRAEAQRQVDRSTTLQKKNLITKEQLEAMRSRLALSNVDLRQARATAERTRLDLQRAKDALSDSKVVSPMEGTIVAVAIEVGAVVAPVGGSVSGPLSIPGMQSGAGAQIIIADLRQLQAHLDVDELDVTSVKKGQRVQIAAQGIRETDFPGRVQRVGLMGRDSGGAVHFMVEVRIGDDDPTDGGPSPDAGIPSEVILPKTDLSGLRPGMSVSAQIEVQRLPGAVVVPVSAILESSGKAGPNAQDRVWVVEEGVDGAVVHRREVTLGPSESEIIAVLSGLKKGEEVVEGPYRALRSLDDSDPVNIDERLPLPGESTDAGPTP